MADGGFLEVQSDDKINDTRNRYHASSQMVGIIFFSGGAVDHGYSLHQSVECCAQPRLPHVVASKITRCQEHTSRHLHSDLRSMFSHAFLIFLSLLFQRFFSKTI